MRKLVVLLTMLAAPAMAQSNDAALERVRQSLQDEAQLTYVATAMFRCNLRGPDWVSRVIRRTQAASGDVYERELSRLTGAQRRGFERDAWRLQAEWRRMAAGAITFPQTNTSCLDIRRHTRAMAVMDQIASGH